jgi:hypothetical protein
LTIIHYQTIAFYHKPYYSWMLTETSFIVLHRDLTTFQNELRGIHNKNVTKTQKNKKSQL